jgi:DMSO/TMAO reductase YedYZ molybdopterin-dependent catalytic subunit
MASVKWLTRIYAVREPFQGYWQTSDYAYWDSVDGKPVRRPLGEIKLKSEIFRPRFYEKIAPNQTYTVFGAAWTVESEVTAVSVSTDGGQTWDKAEFLDPASQYAWRRWKFNWVTPNKPCQCTLLS